MRMALALINLDRDSGRLAHMAQEIAKAGLSFERFPAVQGLAVPEPLKGWFFDAKGTPIPSLKPGEIGVYASHLALHQRLLDDPALDALVVMEDDLEIAPDLSNVLGAIAERHALEPFDIVRLSNPPKAPVLDLGSLVPGRHFVTYSRVPNNMGAYLITRAGAEKSLRFEGLRQFAIDEDFRRPWERGLVTRGVVPAPVRANIFETSSIDAMGARALGQESLLSKLKRRHWPSPAGLLSQWRWQVTELGLGPYLKSILLGLIHSLAKKMSRPLAARIASHFLMPKPRSR